MQWRDRTSKQAKIITVERTIAIQRQVYSALTSTSIDELPEIRIDDPVMLSLNESLPRAP